MPLGKYVCDYCDKQFQDTPGARRRHLQGVAHQRAKALWYDSFRSSSQPSLNQVQDPLFIGKGVCNRFVRTGSCQYGDSCKYYHPNKNLPNMMSSQGTEGTSFVNNIESQKEASLPAVLSGNRTGASLRNLPPSLWPPPEGGYPAMPFIDWG